MHKLSVGPIDYKKAKKEIKSRYLKELGINALFPKTIDDHKRVLDKLDASSQFVLLQQLLDKSSEGVENAVLSAINTEDVLTADFATSIIRVDGAQIPIQVFDHAINEGKNALPLDITYLLRTLSFKELCRLSALSAIDSRRRTEAILNCTLDEFSSHMPYIVLDAFINELTSERVIEPSLEI